MTPGQVEHSAGRDRIVAQGKPGTGASTSSRASSSRRYPTLTTWTLIRYEDHRSNSSSVRAGEQDLELRAVLNEVAEHAQDLVPVQTTRGEGLVQCLELVEHQQSRAPLNGMIELVGPFVEATERIAGERLPGWGRAPTSRCRLAESVIAAAS